MSESKSMLSLFQGLLTGLEEDDKIQEFRVVPEKPSIPQEAPEMPAPVAAFPNPDNFNLTPPEPVVLGQAAQGLPPEPYKLPPVPKYQVELNAPPVVRGKDQSRFDEDVATISRNANTRVLYDQAVQPLASGGLPTKGSMKSKSILGGGLLNRASGYFTDTPEQESQRELTVKVREYFDRDDVRGRIEADPKALAMLQRDPIGYYQSLTNGTVNEYAKEQPFVLESEVPAIGRQVPNVVAEEVPNVVAKEVPNAVVEEVPNVVVEEVPEVAKQEVPKPTLKDNNISAVTAQDAADSAEVIAPEVKTVLDDEIDVVLGNEGFARLMPGEDAGGDLVAEDLDGNITAPDKGFFKKLFDGVGGFLSEQMEDPAVRKTIFAYVASRIAGYDGVTLAAGVLENEWKKKSALLLREQDLADKAADRAIVVADRKLEREQTLEDKDADRVFEQGKLLLEKNAEVLKGLQPDFSKPITMYNPKTRTNQTGSLSSDGTQFYPSNGSAPQTVKSLLSQGFKRGKGDTVKEQRQGLLDLSKTTVSNIRTGIVDQLNASEMKGVDKESIIKSINNATNPNVIRQAVGGFTSRFGPSVDYENMDVTNMFERGLGNYMQAVQEGRATGSKDLEGYLDFELVKFDITKGKGIPSEYWEITNNPNQEIGLNTWSPANNKVKRMLKDINNSKGKKVGSPEVYKQLQLIFKAKSNLSQTDKGNPFLSYWQGVSKTSANDPALAASPFVHFINSIGNPDIDSQYAPQNIQGVTSQILKKLNK